MHGYYKEATIVCNTAKVRFPRSVNHNCYRHWAYALFKEKSTNGKAFKKISKAVKEDPADVDGWILWAMMLRSVGQYKQALNKITVALTLEPENQSATFEKSLIGGMISMDQEISILKGPALKLLVDMENNVKSYPPERRNICSVVCANVCVIF